MKLSTGIMAVVVTATVAVVPVFAGGNKENSQAAVQKKVIGTGNDFRGFCFLDEKGNLAGYDIDTIKAVDELLPQYEFTFETAEFRGILIGLEADKYDIAAHNYAKNAERAAKFLYGTVPSGHYSYQIVVRSDRNDIESLADLEGKKVSTSAGSNLSNFLEIYNKDTAKTPIELVYGSLDNEATVKGLQEGRFDAFIYDRKLVADLVEAFNGVIKGVGPRILPGYTYYIFRKGDTELQQAVDGALKTLRDNGTLSKFSTKWFGQDYSGLLPELGNG